MFTGTTSIEKPGPIMELAGVPVRDILFEPAVTEPVISAFCLLLKVVQSVDVRYPLSEAEAGIKAFCLLLNVVQSVDLRYPFADADAGGMEPVSPLEARARVSGATPVAVVSR